MCNRNRLEEEKAEDGGTVFWFALLSLAKDRLGDISLQLTKNN